MKTRLSIAILALSALSAFANPANQANQAPAPVQNYPAQAPAAAPAYPYVPSGHYYQALPENIMATIQKMYPGVFIKDIDYEPYGYEVELSNRMELHFDVKGNLLGQKFDD